jgi:ComF family protein
LWIEAAGHPLRIALDNISAVVLPSDCRICNRALVQLSRIPVCTDGLNSLTPAHVIACSVCGEALGFRSPGSETLCGVCRRAHPRFDFAISYSSYDGALRRLVHLLKYEQSRPAANVLGAKLAQSLKRSESAADRAVLVIPVPLHPSKRRQRGFNQSELIARSAVQNLDGSRFELHTGNLRRTRATTSQTGLTSHQRRENVRGAFIVTAPARVKDRDVVIVDDVYTTGTTLNECARVLRAAGARQIAVATVARVYREVAEIRPHAVSNQERHAATLVEAAAG